MALKKCKECGHEVSTKAKKCPNCGAPIGSGANWLAITLVIVVFFVIREGVITGEELIEEAEKRVKITKAELKSDNIVSEKSTTPENWIYSSNKDSLTGKPIFNATAISNNSVNFGFPYQGTQNARLVLRTHPQYGKDLILKIHKGQFLCTSYSGCYVKVSFDGENPVTYKANGPSDNSTTVIFLNNYSGFASKMMKSEIVRVQAEFYQEGNRTFEFNVSGFSVDKYRPKSK